MTKTNFIGIGVQKAATTWLHHVLSEHPSVRTSETKELNFFNARYDLGFQWYESRFDPAEPGVIRGECSPNYFYSRDAAQRAWDYNPDFKLICILRDPVERAFSNHLHEIRKGHIPPDTSFEDALPLNPAYTLQSHYKANLQNWLDYFNKGALLVLLSEDVAKDPQGTYRRICAHLGVAPEENPSAITERHHETIVYKNQAVQNALRKGGSVLRSLGLADLVKGLKKAPGLKQALAMNKQHLKTKVSPPTPETRVMLAEQFRDDMEFVAQFLGRDNLPWPTWQLLPPIKTGTHG